MQPTNFDVLGQPREGCESRGTQQAQDSPGIIRALSGARRLRSDESWIEVSSQPSSSSLSSATDEIVTTGLRVQHDSNSRRRRRRLRSLAPTHADISDRPTSAGGSSQEEYEESESESDRVMNSSTEGLQPSGYHEESHPSGPPSSTSEEASSDISEDDDGNSTALGITTAEPVFTPQPNAFSHPPVSAHGRPTHPSSVPNSYFPAQHPPPTRSARHSYPIQRPRTHTPYTLLSPSHQLDHDAALRASLSTLLSCAAAARALPKRDHPTTTTINDPSSRIEPSTLRLVPESAILAPPALPPAPAPRPRQTKKRANAKPPPSKTAATPARNAAPAPAPAPARKMSSSARRS
ncbi:MAG: hypothetical protein FRX48_06493 [Lasallia pustulata]|uniref:Uncharacterized protein n=1 Tax=Lasallia pustulata TaxID=136370 RepID=A0A5M8PLI9_9LECA|nr:MAG: hypothetical protein FRX48_06493 [Lasallia pustulata]